MKFILISISKHLAYCVQQGTPVGKKPPPAPVPEKIPTAEENSGGSFIRSVSVYFASPLDEALASIELLLPPGYLVRKHKLVSPGTQEFLDRAMRYYNFTLAV